VSISIPNSGQISDVDPNSTHSKSRSSRRWIRVATWGIGVALGGFVAFYHWQPWEVDWLGALMPEANPRSDLDSAELMKTGIRVMVVVAHPDDSEFYAGGILHALGEAGARIQLVVATDGDKDYYWFEDHEENSLIRRGEQDRATDLWRGLPPIYLGFADGRVRSNLALRRALEREIQRFEPAVILGFDAEFPRSPSHQDHRRVGQATEAAFEESRWQGWLLRMETRAPNWAFDITSRWDQKQKTVMVHESQFGPKREFILELIRSRAEKDGELIGAALAEGFRVTRVTRRSASKQAY